MKREWILMGAVLAATGAQAQIPSKSTTDDAPRAHGVPGNPPAAAASRILTCEGLFGEKATHAKMTEAFGAANVTFDKQDGAEGETYMGTTLFKKKPADRLIVNWKDEKRRATPDSIVARIDAPAPASNWHLPNGLRPGSSLAEVEAANGKAFALSGFEWDYGGYVNDWKGGSLAKGAGPCNISIRFSPGPAAKTDKVSGDAKFLSSDPRMKAAKPFVSDITVSRK